MKKIIFLMAMLLSLSWQVSSAEKSGHIIRVMLKDINYSLIDGSGLGGTGDGSGGTGDGSGGTGDGSGGTGDGSGGTGDVITSLADLVCTVENPCWEPFCEMKLDDFSCFGYDICLPNDPGCFLLPPPCAEDVYGCWRPELPPCDPETEDCILAPQPCTPDYPECWAPAAPPCELEDDCEAEPDFGVKISYSGWHGSSGGLGGAFNLNNSNTYRYGHDDDPYSHTADLYVTGENQEVMIKYAISVENKPWSGALLVHWAYNVKPENPSQFGSGRMRVRCYSNGGSFDTIYEGSVNNTGGSYVDTWEFGYVSHCSTVEIYAKSVGDGEVRFRIHEVVVIYE